MFTEAKFPTAWDRFLVSSLAGAGDCALFLLWSWKIQCQLTILSNVLISHQPRDGWACYSHILAGFGWQPLATLVDCGFLTHDLVWDHLPLLAYCPEGLRDTLIWSTWLLTFRAKVSMRLIARAQEVHSYHLNSVASMLGSGRQSASYLQNLGHTGSPKHGKGWDSMSLWPLSHPTPSHE